MAAVERREESPTAAEWTCLPLTTHIVAVAPLCMSLARNCASTSANADARASATRSSKNILGIGVLRVRAWGVEGVQEGRDERLGAVLRGILAAVPVEQAERVEADAAPLGARRGEGLVLSLHDFPRVRYAAARG